MDLIKRCLRWLASLRLVAETPVPVGQSTIEVYWDPIEKRIAMSIPHGDQLETTVVLVTPQQARLIGRILINAADYRENRQPLQPSSN